MLRRPAAGHSEAGWEDHWLEFWTDEAGGSKGARAAAAVHPKSGKNMMGQRLRL